MTVQRHLLRLLPALLAMLFVATTPAAAGLDDAVVIGRVETVPQGTASVQPAVDHATRKKPRFSASLEEFFEIDDDAEQYFKPPAALSRYGAGAPLELGPFAVFYRSAPRAYRVSAAYPTGPPHA